MTKHDQAEVPRVVGVCTLSTRWLAAELSRAPGVAAAAPLMTANLGIEELVRSALYATPIRVLVVCGRDSGLFRQGQSLLALAANGVSEHDGRIIGAEGYQPYLRGLAVSDAETFRSRVRVVDLRNIIDPAVLRARIAAYATSCPGAARSDVTAPSGPEFVPLRPGGRRRHIRTAGEGFFVVSTDRRRRELLLRHYREDCVPVHEMRGHRAESMVLGVIDAGLIRELSHAAYLGAELTKAETALRLGLDYFQDLPLRRCTSCASPSNWKVSAVESATDLTRFITRLIGCPDGKLDADLPIGKQTEVSSLQLIELAIALEQECGIELPDDIDLRETTPAELAATAVQAPIAGPIND